MVSTPMAQKYRLLLTLMVMLTLGVFVPQRSLMNAAEPQQVIHELRIYEIFDANKKAFHDRFRDHAMRIMAKYDFKIVATWESKKTVEPSLFTCLNGLTGKPWPAVGRNSCGTRNGSRSRRRRVKCMDRSSARYRIAPCI